MSRADRAELHGRAIYERFRSYPGSEYIAKPGAIQGVIDELRARRPTRILEVGAGIGTLTYTILATLEETVQRARIVTIEHDRFCLDALTRNVGAALDRVEVYPDTRALEPGAFDFVIIDGGTLERGAYTELVAPRGRVIVEGFREHQRSAITAAGRECSFREVWYGGALHGGYWIIQFEPTLVERAVDVLYGLRKTTRGRIAGWLRRVKHAAPAA